MIKPWKTLSSDHVISNQWMRLRADRCQRHDGKIITPFYVREAPDCVCILPLTPNGKVILTTEYRHGIGRVVQGLPGGYADKTDETIEATAHRELLEETGYAAGRISLLGSYYLNWSNQTNRIHYFLAEDLCETGHQDLDGNEEIQLSFHPLESLGTAGFFEQTFHETCLLLARDTLRQRNSASSNR